jgi:polynucleotide 5'-kinase involved in rRNA processing
MLARRPSRRTPRKQGSTEDLTPIAYWLGHLSAAEHAAQFRRATAALAESAAERLGANAAARSGGLIINTGGWVDGAGYDSLL